MEFAARWHQKDIPSIPTNIWSPGKHTTTKEKRAILADLNKHFFIFLCHLKRLQISSVKWLVGYCKIWFLREHKTTSKHLLSGPLASVNLPLQDRCFFSYFFILTWSTWLMPCLLHRDLLMQVMHPEEEFKSWAWSALPIYFSFTRACTNFTGNRSMSSAR